MNKVEFSGWLKKQIKESGKTQAEFSELIGLGQPQLSRILNGSRYATSQVLDRISIALGIPTETVFRAAGLLPQVASSTERESEAALLFTQLTPEQQKLVAGLMRYLISSRD